MKKFFLLLLTSIVLFSSSCARNNRGYKFPDKKIIKIALVLPGSISDSSWNSGSYNGLKRFENDYKAEIAVVEKVSKEEAEKVFPKLAEKEFDLIIGHSYEYSTLLKKLAPLFPKTFFCITGGEISKIPNLCSVNFKNEQYGYLIGVVAGLNTSTNKIGIVVGEKIPSVEKIIVGLRKGLKSVNPKADLIVSYIDNWDDIAKGREAAIEQINTGVDIITHFADIGGIGVIKAAEEADISAIGALSDQHELAPTTVISSGIQDLSQLIFLICEHYYDHSLEPIAYYYGLKDQVIDITPGYGNIDPTTETRINRIKAKLVEMETSKKEEEVENKRKFGG